MKRASFWMAVAALAGFVAAAAASADIVGSDHDLSTKGWNTTGEICVVCHTPHNAFTGVVGAPLWNHASTSAVFLLYSSDTLDAVPGQPDGTSKLCLSCHDGTVAVDNFGGSGGTVEFISGGALVGTDMSNDHPLSFTYDDTLAGLDSELRDPLTQASGLPAGGTIDKDMLFGGKMECASCHDAHGAGFSKFLVKSNAGSALCLTCHIK